ncbi:threonine transporter [Halarcobacter ebronensis]|uniref:Threonine transporter n=1 Tax=Halarcobacter ebronensis TaxID=1462615 RepID=A0A4Q1AQA0_9BACT|nr:LysE family transporter [Halarcobacter ebronensis]QKF82521.1 transporter, LysE family [Halarcobacter ebronensis]RXJ69193.1 threonine transporter [Halarcobacter ebronensis]RXK07462.1 threonine transporter [Halarcobacter ebronensis]
MSEYSFLLAIAVVFIFGSMSPGPSFILVAKTAVSRPLNEGIGISIGLALGAVFFTILAILGLYALFEAVPFLYALFKILGGLYLLYLAYQILKHSNEPLEMNMKLEKNSKGFLKALVFGFLTQISNPKTAIILGSIFAALLPKTMPEYGEILLCLLAFTIDAFWYCIVVFLLSTKKSQKVYLRFKKYIDRVAGSLLAVLGLKLAID